MDDDNDDTGLLTAYGVLIVPPSELEGGWFVSLAEWDEDSERYTASMDGPMYDTQDEAFAAARDIFHRIEASGDDDDLMKMWEAFQAEATPADLKPPELQSDPRFRHQRGW